MKHIYALIPVLFILFCSIANAQDTLRGTYKDYKIEAGEYLLNETVRFNGDLVIAPNVKIVFEAKGTMVIGGSLSAVSQNFDIQLIGSEINPGNGLIIVDNKNVGIDIQGAVFKNLSTPLFFENGWYREKVTISNNQFVENYGRVGLIQILTPYNNYFDITPPIDFQLNGNLFTENNSSIFIQDLGSLNSKIEITNNAFINNKIFGLDSYIISSNLIYGRLDEVNAVNVTKIEANSFIDNYLVSNITNLKLRNANIGVYGTKEIFELKGNFFGTTDPDQIANSIYDKKYNYNSPLVEFEPFLKEPSPKNPTHIYGVLNSQGKNIKSTISLSEPLDGFTALSNTSIDLANAELSYVYFKDSLSIDFSEKIIPFNYIQTKEGIKVSIDQKYDELKGKIGFLQLKNIVDLNKTYVPKLQIGDLAFGEEKQRIKSKIAKNEKELELLEKQQDSLNAKEVKLAKKKLGKFEGGIIAGAAIFRGSISNENFLENDLNTSFGIDLGYNLNSYLTARINISSSTLSNSDLNSGDAEKIIRGMNFSTTVLSISPGIDFDFINNTLNPKSNRIRPSIGIGLDAMSFKPSGFFNGKSYDLTSLGTAGQLLDNGVEPYPTFTLGLYGVLKIKYQIGKYSVGLFASYHSTFSEYLDDVGSDPYPNTDALYEASGENGGAAVYFSNPTSINTTDRLRSDPSSANDSFVKFGISVTRKFFNPKN